MVIAMMTLSVYLGQLQKPGLRIREKIPLAFLETRRELNVKLGDYLDTKFTDNWPALRS